MKRFVAVGILGALAVLAVVMVRHRSAAHATDPAGSDQGPSDEETAEGTQPASPAAPERFYRMGHSSSPFGEAVEPPPTPPANRGVRSTAIFVGGNYPKNRAADQVVPPVGTLTGSAYMREYRQAVCACSSRSCVSDLQPRFLRELASVQYDEQRDGASYTVDAHEAAACATKAWNL
ncbi:MAG TPA: hypothetical protein VHJ20_00205 [Polyangia bacterium]|nr:hypothetical protein [Polyangia bacterium]